MSQTSITRTLVFSSPSARDHGFAVVTLHGEFAEHSKVISETLRCMWPQAAFRELAVMEETTPEPEDSWSEILIEELDFNTRAYGRLKRNGINTVAELVRITEKELRAMGRDRRTGHTLNTLWTFGDKTIAEIVEVLASRGLALRQGEQFDASPLHHVALEVLALPAELHAILHAKNVQNVAGLVSYTPTGLEELGLTKEQIKQLIEELASYELHLRRD